MATENKNIISQALLDADEIKATIKEESKKTLNTLLKEAVADTIRNIVEAKEDEEDYEVIDDEQNDAETENQEEETPEVEPAEEEVAVEPVEGEAAEEDGEEETEEPAEGESDGWDEFSKYQVGDNDTYDLTSEEDYDNIVKVYKLLKDDDNIVVKKDGDKITLKDENADTEYVIDLGTDEEEANGEKAEEPLQESEDIAGIPDMDAEDDEFEDFKPVEAVPEDDNNNMFEGKKTKKMNEKKEAIFEIDLGYTDNYQDKDPIEGLSNAEPSKSGKSWEKGVPTDAKKPWAGEAKPKGQPFDKAVNEGEEAPEEELEEATNVGGAVQQRTSSKSHIPAGRKEYGPKVKRHVSAGGDYEAMVAEAKAKMTKMVKENKELKNAVLELKKSLNEAYVTNVNLGRIVKLFTENTTSKDEKAEIVNRFVNEAKTIEQSKNLYESIRKELNKEPKKNITLESANINVEGSQVLNEEKTFKSQDLINTIDFMKRMSDCR